MAWYNPFPTQPATIDPVTQWAMGAAAADVAARETQYPGSTTPTPPETVGSLAYLQGLLAADVVRANAQMVGTAQALADFNAPDAPAGYAIQTRTINGPVYAIPQGSSYAAGGGGSAAAAPAVDAAGMSSTVLIIGGLVVAGVLIFAMMGRR